MNGIVMESAVKIIAAPRAQSEIAKLQFEGIQKTGMELYKIFTDNAIDEISYLLKLKACSHVVDIEDFAIVQRDDDIRWNVYIRMELLRSLTDYLMERQRLEENVIAIRRFKGILPKMRTLPGKIVWKRPSLLWAFYSPMTLLFA